jgi:hypothetical protein
VFIDENGAVAGPAIANCSDACARMHRQETRRPELVSILGETKVGIDDST